MANIVEVAEVSEIFAPWLDHGNVEGLSKAECDAWTVWADANLPPDAWIGVGDDKGFGRCDITGLRGELVALLADIGEE